jgi:ATP-binding cassette subfamily F protein uup
VALLGDGRVRDLPGGVDEYLTLRRASRLSAAERLPGRPAADNSGGAVSGAAAAREARKELARVERRLERLRADEGRLHEELAAAATDHERVLDLDARLRAVTDERYGLEERWLELAEAAEG